MLIARFQFQVSFTLHCGDHDCGQSSIQRTMVFAGNAVPHPDMPPGWRNIDGMLLCPHHVLAIDGMERFS